MKKRGRGVLLKLKRDRKACRYSHMHVVQQEGHKCAKVWTAVTRGQELINDTVYRGIV